MHKPAKVLIAGFGLGATLVFSGCAQITVTANTLVDGTARIADATTNAVAGTSDFTTDTSRDVDARTHSARLAFVGSDLQILRREAAAGNGEHLRTLAYMMQAKDPAAFSQLLQQNYARIFAAGETPELVLAHVYKVAGLPPDMRHS